MSIFLVILLFYVLPLIFCIAVNAFENWDEVETVGDLLFPYYGVFGDSLLEPVGGIYWIPIVNLFEAFVYVIMLILICLGFSCSWLLKITHIDDLMHKIVNIKIKKK